VKRGFVTRPFIATLQLASALLFVASCAVDDSSTLDNVSPAAGPRGTAVTIRGRAFGLTSAGARVTFNGAAAAIVRWSETEIEALVPPKTNYGAAEIRVVRGGAASAGHGFRVTEYAPGRSAASEQPPVNVPPGRFVSERDCASGEICLTKITGEPGTLVLAVVANNIGFTTGVAFELGFDPAVLRLRSSTPGSAFSAPLLAHAAEAAPGRLLAGIAERARNGARGKLIDSQRTLWLLTFDLISTAETALTFAPGTRDVRSASNAPMPVGWVGGTLEAATSNSPVSSASAGW
jgi:hypothetical protein